MARESPQIRSIIDIEDDLRAVSLGQRDRLRLRRRGGWLGEMGARHDDRAGASDQRFVDVALIQRHVCAVGPIEYRRRHPLGLHGEQHQAAQAVLVGVHPIDDDTLANQLFANETAHLFGADARDQRRPEPEPHSADGDVGGATAYGLGEACDVLEPAADLLAVKVNGRAADRDQIERLVSGGVFGHPSPCEFVEPIEVLPQPSGVELTDCADHPLLSPPTRVQSSSWARSGIPEALEPGRPGQG